MCSEMQLIRSGFITDNGIDWTQFQGGLLKVYRKDTECLHRQANFTTTGNMTSVECDVCGCGLLYKQTSGTLHYREIWDRLEKKFIECFPRQEE